MVAIIGSDVYQPNNVNHDSRNGKCNKRKECNAGSLCQETWLGRSADPRRRMAGRWVFPGGGKLW